ncbi:MAG: DHH family phosphoesterase [Candidatus Woesearchaeota archaeon]
MFVKITEKKDSSYILFDGYRTRKASCDADLSKGEIVFLEGKKAIDLDSAIKARIMDIPGMHEVCKTLIKAMLEGKQIFLRHHADADGICGALSLERVLPVKMRLQSRRPAYDDSVLREMGMMQNGLVVLIDHGSTPDSLFALQVLEEAGIDYCIIDHHRPVARELSQQVNSEEYTAGMLAFEIAQVINPTEDYTLPAISGIGDKSPVRIYADKCGKNDEELKQYALALDFMAFMGGKSYLQIIRNKGLARTMALEAEDRINVFLASAEIKEEKIGDVTAVKVDLQGLERRFPNAGKIVGHLLTRYEEAFVMGVLEDHIIIRSNAGPDIQAIVEKLELNGGGHARAGTIHFESGRSELIIKRIKGLF